MYADQAQTEVEKDRGAVQSCSGQAATQSRLGYSLRDEAQKRAMHHHEQADKAKQAAVFLSQHPEFEEFIRLVRSGALQF